MTNEQVKFFDLLNLAPSIKKYWDKDRCEVNLAKLRAELNTLSTGETVLAKFFADLWLGGNEFGFCLNGLPSRNNKNVRQSRISL